MANLLRLIVGGYGFTDDRVIFKVAADLKMDLKADAYTCLVIRCDAPISDSGDYQRQFLALPQCCKKFFQKKSVRTMSTFTDSGECVVVLFGTFSNKSLERWLDSLSKHLKKHHYEKACIVACDPVQRISALHDAYMLAKNVLFRNSSDNISVIYSKNIQTIYNSSILQNGTEFEKILRCFRAGDLEQVEQYSKLYAEKVRALSPKQPGDPYPSSIKRMFIELTVYVLHIASDAGVDVDVQLGHIDPYTHLMSLRGTPKIIDWFIDVCREMLVGINEKAQRKESNLILRACKYIDEHLCNYDLSLETVSAHVNVTPSYFSALFRKEKGIGFSAYIGKARINMAMDLLQNTDLSVAEIAVSVGFSSVNYFTRMFKKALGVPPGQYRSEYQMKKP